LDNFAESVSAEGTSVGALVHSFEDRSLGVVLVVLSGLLLIPVIGGLPGVPDALATLMLIFIVQSWLGRKGVWVPKFIAKRELGEDKLDAAIEKARPWAQRVDKVLKTRMSVLVRNRPARVLISIVCAVLAASVFVLGFVPFAMLPAAAAIFAFGLALIGRDGLLALIGYMFVAGTGFAMWKVAGMVI